MKRVTAFLAVTFVMLLILGSFSIAQQNLPRKPVQRQHRVVIRPEIPKAKRNSQLVFLEHADELLRRDFDDYMVLVGNVEFSKGAMHMYTDSAHYYDETGSFDAFGNVRMEQGDTLFIYGDELNYDGETEIAVLFGYDGKPVQLINRDVKLETDIFTYDMYEELGYYNTGGTLTDRENKLTSHYGEYSPSTKEALFRDNVQLTSRRPDDELHLVNEALFYNTDTHIAEFHVPTKITNKDGIIDSDDGYYNTETGIAELYQHSIVTTNRGSTLEGDTLYYDRANGIGEAWGNMALVDTVKSSILFGDYGYYNELIDSAFVTGRAKAMEFSNGDTLYVHGKYITSVLKIDTLVRVTGVDTIYIDPILSDNVGIIADSLTSSMEEFSSRSDSLLNPTVFTEEIISFTETEGIQNVSDTIVEISTLDFPLDSLDVSEEKRQFRIEELTEQYVDSTHIISAWPRVRMYRTDMQGLCDSLVFTQADSMVRMFYHPIVWSEDRQIFGNTIELHVNDSTVESATLPDFGFMAQHIEDQFYNQLTGKTMKAWFLDGQLNKMLIEGSVEGIMYPEEADSTINKLVNFQTANLEGYFENQVVKRIKMWPKTTGEAIPLYLAKYTDLTLPKFKWYTGLRPLYPDDIFNIPPEMDELMSDRPVASPFPTPALPVEAIPDTYSAQSALTEETTVITAEIDNQVLPDQIELNENEKTVIPSVESEDLSIIVKSEKNEETE